MKSIIPIIPSHMEKKFTKILINEITNKLNIDLLLGIDYIKEEGLEQFDWELALSMESHLHGLLQQTKYNTIK